MKQDALQMSLLLDYYGELLSQKQRTCFDLYYNQDLSLSEIAAELGVSRQGVHELLSRAEASLGEFERVGIVAVNANSVGGDLDSAAVNRFDGAFLNRAHHARYGEVLVGDHGVFLLARHQRAVSHVIAIGEEFLRGGKARCSPRFDELSASEAYEHERRVEIVHCGGDCLGEGGVFRGTIVKLPVRFHVGERSAFRFAESGKR